MERNSYRYVIIGAGRAGASAVEGIRQIDRNGPILMLGLERELPYDRPPLSKQLWWGAMEVPDIFIHDDAFYADNGVTFLRGTLAVSIDPARKTVTDQRGAVYGYEKLLLATGAEPRTLPLPGGTRGDLLYYRYLDDYRAARERLSGGQPVTVIGGGFIGSEMAASLARAGQDVTVVFPEEFICSRVFPGYLAAGVQEVFRRKGVKLLSGNRLVSITRDGDRFVSVTGSGAVIASSLVVIGIGVTPSTKLAEYAGLETDRGIVVDEYLRTSGDAIFAAGDNASFPYPGLRKRMRLEHWDNARSQGFLAGKNMAGAGEPVAYMPEFYTELFDLSFKAVGDLRSEYRTIADWQAEKLTGTIYYLDDKRVVGVLFCNIEGDREEARRIIMSGEVPEHLRAEAAATWGGGTHASRDRR